MSQTIHFGEKFKTSLMKYFALKSVTEHAFNHSLDQEFVGSDIVHVFKIATTKLNQYDKTIDPSKGSRFGAVQEVGDHKYTFRLTQDISLDRSVDRGNNDAQFNIKKVGAIMKAYTDERIRPEKDKYRLKKWVDEAGIHFELPEPITKANIAEMVILVHNAMIEEGVPENEGTLYIARKYVPALKLAEEWVKLDSLGGKTLPKGAAPGEFDGLVVQPVSTRLFPAGCAFSIFHKDAIIAPEKINTFRGIKDSENMDGDRLQFRLKHDAFVLPTLADGAAAACEPGTVAKTPTVNISGGKATVTSDEGVVYYTLDGSDPRYQSAEAKVYSAAVAVKSGDIFRCCAKVEGKWWSAATYDEVE